MILLFEGGWIIDILGVCFFGLFYVFVGDILVGFEEFDVVFVDCFCGC